MYGKTYITHTWTFYKYRWVSQSESLCMNNLWCVCMYVGVDIQWSYAITHWKMCFFLFLHKTARERSTQRFFISTKFYRFGIHTHTPLILCKSWWWECLCVWLFVRTHVRTHTIKNTGMLMRRPQMIHTYDFPTLSNAK